MWHRLPDLLIGLVALISVLAFVGTIYQVVATRLSVRKYPPPGRLVDVGGYRLHINCAGNEVAQGSPTVVMDAGIGECSIGWSLVQPEIAKFARVCTYDRAGLGWSDPAPTPRTSRQIVNELHTLLVNAGIEPPYVMVGHSFGGLNVRLYASQFPEEVAGLVMVDACHEEYPIRDFCPLYVRLGMLTAPLGIPRLFAGMAVSGNPIFAGDSRYPSAYRAIATTTKYLHTALREWSSVDESWNEARRSTKTLGDKPLVVLLATSEHENFPFICQLETELASRSTEGKLVMVERSGHHIQHDRAETVIEAVREVVEAVRHKSLPASPAMRPERE
ncbi:MAG TPA: alpha/beta hydrolase [Pyrinomonadaceae bacterium]|nr:alpha/beta hydrolase [Pyrinomonadaceae bacterium]